uniref:translation elongation factor Ts n=1 Tax=Neisseria meningitidis TaxID=487 RepID=UPI000BB63B93
MANYTAADVKSLREATGSAMLDCKNALAENGGDYDKAVEFLRIKGAKNVSKRADREATEGLVAVSGNTMVEINCETDFVAKNEGFQSFANKIVEAAAAAKANSPEELNNVEIDGQKVSEFVD